MNYDNYFQTTNFYLASFAFAKGLPLVDIDRSEKRCKFIFPNSKTIEKLIRNFNFSQDDAEEVRVDARKLIIAIKTLKDKLYQE